MATENKREYARRADSTIVDFVVEGHLYRGFTKNWSRDGVFIRTAGRFSEGQNILTTFVYPKIGSDKKTGKIVRYTSRGIGVKFNQSGIPDKTSKE